MSTSVTRNITATSLRVSTEDWWDLLHEFVSFSQPRVRKASRSSSLWNLPPCGVTAESAESGSPWKELDGTCATRCMMDIGGCLEYRGYLGIPCHGSAFTCLRVVVPTSNSMAAGLIAESNFMHNYSIRVTLDCTRFYHIMNCTVLVHFITAQLFYIAIAWYVNVQ